MGRPTAPDPEKQSVTALPPVEVTESGRATVLFTGDLMLARSIGDIILAEGPQAPWEGIADELAAADLRVGVLETAVGSAGVAEDKAYTFQAPPEAADSLSAGGFDVVTLANNHSYDFGAEGLLETERLVVAAGVRTVGAGDSLGSARSGAILAAEGVELGFLGYVAVPDDWSGYRNQGWAAAIPESLESALLTVTFTPETIEDASFVPVLVDDRGLPQTLDPEGAVGRTVLDRLEALPTPSLPWR